MRRILITSALTAALVLPALALAGDGSDGTLSVRNATGMVSVAARGTLLGHCGRCTITIVDPDPTDGAPAVVKGNFDISRQLSPTKTTWCCESMRFKLIGGFFRIKIVGTGIDISAVATGSAALDNGSTGSYSVDGAPFEAMPTERTSLPLGGG
jgi:hypothetical protein